MRSGGDVDGDETRGPVEEERGRPAIDRHAHSRKTENVPDERAGLAGRRGRHPCRAGSIGRRHRRLRCRREQRGTSANRVELRRAAADHLDEEGFRSRSRHVPVVPQAPLDPVPLVGLVNGSGIRENAALQPRPRRRARRKGLCGPGPDVRRGEECSEDREDRGPPPGQLSDERRDRERHRRGDPPGELEPREHWSGIPGVPERAERHDERDAENAEPGPRLRFPALLRGRH